MMPEWVFYAVGVWALVVLGLVLRIAQDIGSIKEHLTKRG